MLFRSVIGYDLFPKEGVDDIVTQVSMDEVLEKSDIITLHAPYIKENEISQITSNYSKTLDLIKDKSIKIKVIKSDLKEFENKKMFKSLGP